MATAPPNNGFTGATQTYNTASILDLGSKFSSDQTKTTGRTAASQTGSGSQTTTGSNASGTGAANSANASQSSSTTFATSPSPIPGVSGSATLSYTTTPTATATNAASSTTGAVTVSKSSCNSISCSSALQAAVAVPVVVAVLAAIFLFFFCARRRRQRAGAVVSEKRPPKAGKKKWTRHLRAFSFDAELLMGGRFSSSNSLRSRDASIRSGAGSVSRNGAHSAAPSLHSVEEVAPPYRDAISHATPPHSPPRSMPAVRLGADPTPRPLSTATAPPPYRAIVHGASPEPASSSTARNPFTDSAPVSPIDESPFNDPPEAGGALAPALSRGSSMYRSINTDDAATPTASDAGSIREAIVGRRVSVRNAGSTSGGSS